MIERVNGWRCGFIYNRAALRLIGVRAIIKYQIILPNLQIQWVSEIKMNVLIIFTVQLKHVTCTQCVFNSTSLTLFNDISVCKITDEKLLYKLIKFSQLSHSANCVKSINWYNGIVFQQKFKFNQAVQLSSSNELLMHHETYFYTVSLVICSAYRLFVILHQTNLQLLIFFFFVFFSWAQLSNFLFLLVPPISIYLFRDYGHFINRGIHVIWTLMIVIGFSSAYFHATLSLVGQLLDEVSILWALAAVYAQFFPKKLFPKWMNGNR